MRPARLAPSPVPSVKAELAPERARLVGSASRSLPATVAILGRRGLAVKARAEGWGPGERAPRGSGAPGGWIYSIAARQSKQPRRVPGIPASKRYRARWKLEPADLRVTVEQGRPSTSYAPCGILHIQPAIW